MLTPARRISASRAATPAPGLSASASPPASRSGAVGRRVRLGVGPGRALLGASWVVGLAVVVEQGRQPVAPQALAQQVGADLVELREGGIDARFDGALAQQAGGKGVDGRDGRVVETVERGGEAVAFGRRELRAGRVVAGEPRLEGAADALAQLAGGLLGEGDGDHRRDGRRVGARQAGEVAVDQHAGLAGAGAGFDQEGRVEVGRGAPPHVVVDRP